MLIDLKKYKSKNILRFGLDFFQFTFRPSFQKKKYSFDLDAGDVITFPFLSGKCNTCMKCVEECPAIAIFVTGNKGEKPKELLLDVENCVNCNICVSVCPENALSKKTYTEEDLFRKKIINLIQHKP